MNILIELFYVFFTIGLFCFGGGYAIIPFIQEEIVSRNWISAEAFIDIIAVAESTPGPISINTATFVGYKLEGVLGAAVATFGLCLPTFVIVVFVSSLLATTKGKNFLDRITVGIRPMVVALIFVAAYSIAQTVFFGNNQEIATFQHGMLLLLSSVTFIATLKSKCHPIIFIAMGALFGLIL